MRDIKIRQVLSGYVVPCHEAWLREKGRWCWYDTKDSYAMNGGAPFATKEAALDDAVWMAKAGRVFVRQLEQIDHELKP